MSDVEDKLWEPAVLCCFALWLGKSRFSCQISHTLLEKKRKEKILALPKQNACLPVPVESGILKFSGMVALDTEILLFQAKDSVMGQ